MTVPVGAGPRQRSGNACVRYTRGFEDLVDDRRASSRDAGTRGGRPARRATGTARRTRSARRAAAPTTRRSRLRPIRRGGTARPTARARGRARGGGARGCGRRSCACGREHPFDRVAVRVGAVHGEREPQRQAARPPGELVRVVGRVPPVGLVVDHVEVRRVLRVHRAGERGVAVEQRRAVERRVQPLVRVDHERVGVLDAGEPLAHARCEQRGAAVRRVDVHPDAALAAHRARRRRGRRRGPALVVPAVATTAQTDAGIVVGGERGRAARRR